MVLNRRKFLKASTGAVGLLLLPMTNQNALAADLKTKSDVAMLVDTSKCVGCWWCYAACKNYNKIPETIAPKPENPPILAPQVWTTLATVDKGGTWSFRKQACMHCTDAACVEVCPTGALSYNSMGFVQYDKEKCSGCGYCAEFCPFGVPQMESNTITGNAIMNKCTFCIDRVTNGESPACAEACTTGAIKYGKRSNLLVEGQERVTSLRQTNPNAVLYGEKELGGLHVMYVLDEPPQLYSLPASPELPAAAQVRGGLKWVGIGAAVAAVAGFGINYLIAREAKMAEELPGKEYMKRGRNG